MRVFLSNLKNYVREKMPKRVWHEGRRLYRNVQAMILRSLYPSEENRSLLDIPKKGFPPMYYRSEPYGNNELYGMAHHLRRYCGYQGKMWACIEHGVYFGDPYFADEVDDLRFPAIITFSETRRRHLRDLTDKPVLTLGPYINYSQPFLSENEFEKLKNELGRTLLAFPPHSTAESSARYSLQEMCEILNGLRDKGGYQTVLLSFFFKDLSERSIELCKRFGFKPICAGHSLSTQFLPRLKSFIDLADMTVSSSVGTQVGYCVSRGKPHYIIAQDVELLNVGSTGIPRMRIADQRAACIEEMEVLDSFSQYEETITNRQLEVVHKYWGPSTTIDPGELKLYLEYFEHLHNTRFSSVKADVPEPMKWMFQ